MEPKLKMAVPILDGEKIWVEYFWYYLSFFTVVANLFLIIIIVTSRHRQQRVNQIAVSLAVADFFCGAFVMPFSAYRFGRWPKEGETFCDVALSLEVIILCSSIYNFVFLNIDRMLQIKFPEMYKKLEGISKFNYGVIACWVLALVPASPMWLFDTILETRSSATDGSDGSCSFPYIDRAWVWWTAVTALLIPSIIIVLIWCTIAHHDWNHQENRGNNTTFWMTVITLTFLSCWWPYAIIFLLDIHNPDIDDVILHDMKLAEADILVYANSLMNPLIYMACNKNVRKLIVKTFTCKRGMCLQEQKDLEDIDLKDMVVPSFDVENS